MTDRTVWGLGIFDGTSRYDEMKRKTIDRTVKKRTKEGRTLGQYGWDRTEDTINGMCKNGMGNIG